MRQTAKNFTFHNVSISTQSAEAVQSPGSALHSTMYLFLPQNVRRFSRPNRLYIPQCIYFYDVDGILAFCGEQLYIPQCIYFYTPIGLFAEVVDAFTFHNVSISTERPSSA